MYIIPFTPHPPLGGGKKSKVTKEGKVKGKERGREEEGKEGEGEGKEKGNLLHL